ncbi:hypothetical protein [Variovorax boronicumulans]|uniref:hypothetical protein n=1 Tax=Variovorax boronicumulans TaxID=436515 RepID=UPI001C569B53
MGRYLLTFIVLAAFAPGAICLFLMARGTPSDPLRGPALSRAARPMADAARTEPPPVSALGDDVPAWVRRAEKAAKPRGDGG